MPTVNAAPKHPTILSVGVPKASDTISHKYPDAGRFNITPKAGAISINGNPVVNQCANALTATTASSGSGEVAISSSAPSSQSKASSRSKDNRQDNSAASHRIPDAMDAKTVVLGPTPNGTNTTTIRKKTIASPNPPPARVARRRSRFNKAIMKRSRQMALARCDRRNRALNSADLRVCQYLYEWQ